jgi:glycosyltransferase involved in cell wall biosynthesis
MRPFSRRVGMTRRGCNHTRPPSAGRTEDAVVSVIIPCYDCEQYVGEAIDSVLSQDHRSLELIVVDDGATDQSVAAAQSRANSDPRVRVLRLARNLGRAAALNAGIDGARGEFICFLDADDLLSPGRLTKQVDFLRSCPEIAMVYGDFERQREDGTILEVPASRSVEIPDPRGDVMVGAQPVKQAVRNSLTPARRPTRASRSRPMTMPTPGSTRSRSSARHVGSSIMSAST